MLLKDIEIIEKECFSPPYLFENLKKMYDNKRYHFLYEIRDKTVVSYSILLEMVDVIEIIRLAVLKNTRGTGEGSKILEKSISFIEETEFEKIFLEVREGNEKAIKLYEKFGFERITIRKNYYSDGENAIVMLKAIN